MFCGLSAHDSPIQTSGVNMKKSHFMETKNETEPVGDVSDMQDHYSFKGGQRGRYAHLFPETPHLVVLSPDMAAVFPDSDSVNEALRILVKAAQTTVPLTTEREAA
jgi:hypothetical protein